jgi:hypothetical protein
MCPGISIFEVLRTHSDTPCPVVLLWKGDRHLRRDLYLTARSKQKELISMTLAGLELWNLFYLFVSLIKTALLN